MPITNGYATLAQFQQRAAIDDLAPVDDAVIERLIEAASRYIDRYTGRTFYARSQTRHYDMPYGLMLLLDDDLLTITTLTNGDGATIASTEYVLKPYNDPPYYAIDLVGSTAGWQPNNNGVRRAISVAGTWGYSSSAPTDITEACLQIAWHYYQRRFGENVSGIATVTAAGVIIAPEDIPNTAAALIKSYRKVIP